MKKHSLIILTILIFFLGSSDLLAQENILSLSEAIEKTLLNNYGIRVSAIESEQAEIFNTRGNAGGLPTIDFDASSLNSLRYSEGSSTEVNSHSADLGISWKIFDGFKVRYTREKLQDLQELSQGQSAVVIENTLQELIMNYYYILLLKENLEVLKKLEKLSSDRYEYEKAKYEIGGSVSVNVLLAKNLWLNDKASSLSQEIAVKDAIRTLNYIMAEKDNPSWTLSESFSYEIKEYSISAMQEKMMSNNQVLKNQYLNQSLAEKERKIKESDLFPELTLSAGILNSYYRTETSGSVSGTNTFYPYGNLSFSYDFYTGGTRNTAIKVAELNEEISGIEMEEMSHKLTNSLLGIYDQYLLKTELLSIAEENLEVTEMNLSISEKKFKNGSITSFEYRDIQMLYLNAAQARLSVIYDLLDIETEFTRLTGGFISPE